MKVNDGKCDNNPEGAGTGLGTGREQNNSARVPRPTPEELQKIKVKKALKDAEKNTLVFDLNLGQAL